MKVYFYDNQGLFVGIREVEKIPAGATDQKPPETWPPNIPIWNGEEWETVKDQRGKYWNKQTRQSQEITEIGIELSEEWTPDAPPTERAVWDDKQGWIEPPLSAEEIQAERDRQINAEVIRKLPELIKTVSTFDQLKLAIKNIEETSCQTD